jgi:hypothetical protein
MQDLRCRSPPVIAKERVTREREIEDRVYFGQKKRVDKEKTGILGIFLVDVLWGEEQITKSRHFAKCDRRKVRYG